MLRADASALAAIVMPEGRTQGASYGIQWHTFCDHSREPSHWGYARNDRVEAANTEEVLVPRDAREPSGREARRLYPAR